MIIHDWTGINKLTSSWFLLIRLIFQFIWSGPVQNINSFLTLAQIYSSNSQIKFIYNLSITMLFIAVNRTFSTSDWKPSSIGWYDQMIDKLSCILVKTWENLLLNLKREKGWKTAISSVVFIRIFRFKYFEGKYNQDICGLR